MEEFLRGTTVPIEIAEMFEVGMSEVFGRSSFGVDL
jgi:hypothetical protein